MIFENKCVKLREGSLTALVITPKIQDNLDENTGQHCAGIKVQEKWRFQNKFSDVTDICYYFTPADSSL